MPKNFLITSFIVAAGSTALISYDFYSSYKDYEEEAEIMKRTADYEVDIIDSKDYENEDGYNVTSYTLSSRFVLRNSVCTSDRAQVETEMIIERTSDHSFSDHWLIPESYKQEQVKKDYRLDSKINSVNYLVNMDKFFRLRSTEYFNKLTADQLLKNMESELKIRKSNTWKSKNRESKATIYELSSFSIQKENDGNEKCIERREIFPLLR
jgi:hypothetical protein